jgi:hypothetical protein
MQRRTQMNLRLQQQWTHDGEEATGQTTAAVKSRLPQKPAKRKPPVTRHR